MATKPGQYGPLYLYQIAYTDPSDDGCGEHTERLWAYNTEHALDRFYGSVDSDGWKALKICRVPATGGMHRARWHQL